MSSIARLVASFAKFRAERQRVDCPSQQPKVPVRADLPDEIDELVDTLEFLERSRIQLDDPDN